MARHVAARHTAVFCLLALSWLPAWSEEKKENCVPKVIAEFVGKVVGVSDGDTITVLTADRKQIKIRLEGIDAPESGQAYGQKAKQALSDLVFSKTVTIKKTGKDRYKRTLALVYLDQQHINDTMVQEGFAWQYKTYNCEARVQNLEVEARKGKKGLWADAKPIPPWDFRAKPKAGATAGTAEPTPAEKTAPAQTLSHWLNTDSGARHNSSCRWFKNTQLGRLCGPNDGRACKTCGG